MLDKYFSKKVHYLHHQLCMAYNLYLDFHVIYHFYCVCNGMEFEEN
jgi:hypothetical protein